MSGTSFSPQSPEAKLARSTAKLPGGGPHIEYIYNHDLELAVRVALAIERPLLLRGDPGCGKSTLARDVALVLRRDFYEAVISSRTRALDLQWQFDTVRRLGDAQAKLGRLDQPHRYLDPGVLWWAFNPSLAKTRGLTPHDATAQEIELAKDPAWKTSNASSGAVVLLDEIDKADPDVPNDLLVPLGESRINVPHPSVEVTRARDVLVVITTNGERDLPPAFLRRCVTFTLKRPEPGVLRAIAKLHCPKASADLVEDVRLRLDQFGDDAGEAGRKPGTAEFLDAVRACSDLQIRKGHVDWELVMQSTLSKIDAPSKHDSTASTSPS